MHGVHTDKRPGNTKDPAERGPRISLTFRHIGTFLTPLLPSPSSPAGQEQAQAQRLIFGQGATGKTRAEARPVVRGSEGPGRLLAAFGVENHQSEFDFENAYGEGSDVLHFTTPPALLRRHDRASLGLPLGFVTVSPSCDRFCCPLSIERPLPQSYTEIKLNDSCPSELKFPAPLDNGDCPGGSPSPSRPLLIHVTGIFRYKLYESGE